MNQTKNQKYIETLNELGYAQSHSEKWQSVRVGTFTSPQHCLRALEGMDIRICEGVRELLVSGQVTISSIEREIDLVAIPIFRLGFSLKRKVRIKTAIARAYKLGLLPVSIEAAVALRLSYKQTTIVDYLTMAMDPIIIKEVECNLDMSCDSWGEWLLIRERPEFMESLAVLVFELPRKV